MSDNQKPAHQAGQITPAPRALALDLGSAFTGWAYPGASGVLRISRGIKTGTPRTIRHRLVARRLHDEIHALIASSSPDVIVVESAAAHARAASQGVMRGVTRLLADLLGIPIHEVAPNSWQSWAKRLSVGPAR